MKVSSKYPAIQSLIDKLESHGFKISLNHRPCIEGVSVYYSPIIGQYDLFTRKFARKISTPFRGTSVMTITDPDGFKFVGESFCSVNDSFNRAEGARVAFGKAIKELHEAKGRQFVKNLFA